MIWGDVSGDCLGTLIRLIILIFVFDFFWWVGFGEALLG
jgi:hypothetical protein